MFHPVAARSAARRISDDEAATLADLLNQLEALVAGAERLAPDLGSPFAARVAEAKRRIVELRGVAGALAEAMGHAECRRRNLI